MMMETKKHEQCITFPLDLHEGVQDDVSHEEICEPVDECVLHEELIEITIANMNQNIEETSVVEILTENSEDDEQNSIMYPIYIKKETSKQFTTGDESMAVEALRQLGGMYPCSEDKKIACPNCADLFTQIELSNHHITCTTSKHICHICGEKFERKMDLNNHVVCHQVDRPHACRTCGNLFRSKTNLQSHMIEVHQVVRPHKCTVCGADFQRPSSLSNHMKIHNYVAGRALMQNKGNNISNSQDVTLTNTVQSIQNFEISQVQWAMQSYNYADDQNNVEGLLSDSDKIDTLQELTVLSNVEVAPFQYVPQNFVTNQDSQQYNLSLNSFNNSDTTVKVEVTNLSNENKKGCIEINLQKNKINTCSQCGVSFAHAASLSLHEKIHPKELALPVECEYCDKQFQDTNFLTVHHASCSKRLMQNNMESNAPNVKWGKHSCSECGKKFTTKQKMFRHQWIHRKKTHSCEVCGLQYEKQSELDEHRLSAHPGDSPFTCYVCGKSFVSRQGLWEHGRTHAGSPAYFHCDKCSKTFSSRQGYLIHHRTHTGERPYGCKFCWKAFRDGGTLRKHERIHTGERPHVCPLCARAFNQKVVLREHVRWVHAAGKNETEAVEPPFPCPLCGTLTQDRDELCAHIVKHSDLMIAEAKIKSNNDNVKTKLQEKKKKVLSRKAKPENLKAIEKQTISKEEQNEALFSITDQTESSREIQDTYLLVKNEYNDAVCIKTYTRSKDISQTNLQQESINLTTIGKSLDDKDEETINFANKQGNIDTMQLIPFTTSAPDETIHLISTPKSNNILHLISKQNESLPVLTIPNLPTNEIFPNQITFIKDVSKIEMSTNNSSMYNEKFANMNAMIIKSVDIESIIIEQKRTMNENGSNDESEELVCGICGNDFDDKNVFMEHVKIHI